MRWLTRNEHELVGIPLQFIEKLEYQDPKFTKFEAACFIWARAERDADSPYIGNLKPGQLMTSIPRLMEQFKWSRGKLERFLQLLENAGYITVEKPRSRELLITIKHHYVFEPEQEQEEQSEEDEELDEYFNLKMLSRLGRDNEH